MSNQLTQLAKNILLRLKNYIYHRRHKKEAYKILKYLETTNGKLSPVLKKEINEYSRLILGWKGYAPWLLVYSAIAGDFKYGWIPDNYYGANIVPKLKGKYGEVTQTRALTRILFQSDLFPDILYFTNGLFLSTDYSVLQDDEVNNLLSSYNKLIFKSDSSSQGKGVTIINPEDNNAAKLRHLGNGVFQKYINQNDFFSEIQPDSVSTIRMTTAVDNTGTISLRACYLGIGRKGEDYVMGASLIRVSIDNNTGELAEYGYTPKWQAIKQHPDSKFIFAKKIIPNFEELKQATIDLHKKIPFVRIVGWDLILNNQNKIEIMELNGGHNDIKFSEATQGPLFRDLELEKHPKISQ
jgi:hypothetical protein